MPKNKLLGWLLGGMLLAILSLSLIPPAAVASPLMGFTDTPVPQPTSPSPTQEPPSGPVVVDPIITKRADVDHAQVGDLVHYTLDISNPNSVDVYNVVISDPLPNVVDFLGSNTTQGTCDYDAGAHTLTCTIGTLVAGQSLQVSIITRVNSKATPPDQFGNTAILTWDSGRTVTSNTVIITLIPSALPKTGEGPGWAEIAVMAGVLLAGLAALGSAAFGVWRLARRT